MNILKVSSCQSFCAPLVFFHNAIRLTNMPGRTVASVAVELKIPAWKLRTWIKNSRENIERSEDLNELTRLANEAKSLKEEIEILKVRSQLCEEPGVK